MQFKVWLETEVIPCGDCFRFAVMRANEMFTDGIIPDKQIKVVHAIVHPKWHHRPYVHAWIEAKGRVYDWQMSRTVGSLTLKDFYDEYKPTDIKKYSRQEALRKMIKMGHFGPW